MTPDAALAASLDRVLPEGTARLGVAVSGGGDSLALLVLVSEWAATRGVRVLAATVDHGLRPDAAAEARHAAGVAAAVGIAHETLPWQGAPARGNLQAAARAARYGCLAGWAGRHGIAHVCLAHTRDDQAETVLLRLARGSGVDGLAAMPEGRREAGGPDWLRPLLGVGRADLRDVLRARGIGWIEDPTNDDTRFDRIKARHLLADPPLAGLTAGTLAETAQRMAAARVVLDRAAGEAAERIAEVDLAAVTFVPGGYAALPDDTRWRLLAAALCRVAGQVYRPRFSALKAADAAACAGGTHTLHGCLVSVAGNRIRIDREPEAAARVTAPVPGDWDGRWRIEGPDIPGTVVSALGPEGLADLGSGAAGTMPRTALMASPAIRRDGRLLGAPLVGGNVPTFSRWSATPLWGKLTFITGLRSD